jgi:hypothetical protein
MYVIFFDLYTTQQLLTRDESFMQDDQVGPEFAMFDLLKVVYMLGDFHRRSAETARPAPIVTLVPWLSDCICKDWCQR